MYILLPCIIVLYYSGRNENKHENNAIVLYITHDKLTIVDVSLKLQM